MRPPKISIGHAIVVGGTASFRGEGSEASGETATGSIKMILEDRKWKVLEDKWQVSRRPPSVSMSGSESESVSIRSAPRSLGVSCTADPRCPSFVSMATIRSSSALALA